MSYVTCVKDDFVFDDAPFFSNVSLVLASVKHHSWEFSQAYFNTDNTGQIRSNDLLYHQGLLHLFS
jgi:hypothetical protein